MFLSLLLLNAVINQHSDALSVSTDADAKIYLATFGYLDLKNSTTASVSGVSFRRAISDFQSFAGLNSTGILDVETSTWMNKPRCGVPDRLIRRCSSIRHKRNVDIEGNRWNKKHLTYRISKYTTDLEKSVVDQEIAKAFQVWADVTELTFTFVETGIVDIDIRFESGNYSVKDQPFDGLGGILAHGFFPKSGDIHFDEDETWTINSGTDLFQVAVHEFGHALGLEHTDVKPAVMKPIYDGFEPDFKLEADEIEKIQKLYGKNIDNNWIKEKFQEIASALMKSGNELKETNREMVETKIAIADLNTKLNVRTEDIKFMDGEMPTSCKDLELIGQRINGIFLVKGKTKIDAVFCDFNPTKNNEIKQKRIGHAVIKSESVYFYVQRNSPFSTPRTAIPFDHARVNKGNAMDLATGIFTSQRAGTYFFSFTGLASFPETTSPNRLHLGIGFYVDGNCIGRTKKEKTNTVENQYSPLNLQTTVDLVANNNIWLEIDLLSSGVVLHDAEGDNSWTHFTGWMLEEEIVSTIF